MEVNLHQLMLFVAFPVQIDYHSLILMIYDNNKWLCLVDYLNDKQRLMKDKFVS